MGREKKKGQREGRKGERKKERGWLKELECLGLEFSFYIFF